MKEFLCNLPITNKVYGYNRLHLNGDRFSLWCIIWDLSYETNMRVNSSNGHINSLIM